MPTYKLTVHAAGTECHETECDTVLELLTETAAAYVRYPRCSMRAINVDCCDYDSTGLTADEQAEFDDVAGGAPLGCDTGDCCAAQVLHAADCVATRAAVPLTRAELAKRCVDTGKAYDAAPSAETFEAYRVALEAFVEAVAQATGVKVTRGLHGLVAVERANRGAA